MVPVPPPGCPTDDASECLFCMFFSSLRVTGDLTPTAEVGDEFHVQATTCACIICRSRDGRDPTSAGITLGRAADDDGDRPRGLRIATGHRRRIGRGLRPKCRCRHAIVSHGIAVRRRGYRNCGPRNVASGGESMSMDARARLLFRIRTVPYAAAFQVRAQCECTAAAGDLPGVARRSCGSAQRTRRRHARG